MAEKRSVTVSLTARQKEQIKRATGKSISALKVGPSGGMVAARKIQILSSRKVQVGRAIASRKMAVGRAIATRKMAVGRAIATRKMAVGRAIATRRMAVGRAIATRKTSIS